ncbi:hypothetical protein AGR8A_pAt30114 [Agrobacterium fabrum str. J-07]|nr:hypothetical protein AGR8A_pAt30114 [Agrobacterium fabrum str. J-07]
MSGSVAGEADKHNDSSSFNNVLDRENVFSILKKRFLTLVFADYARLGT